MDTVSLHCQDSKKSSYNGSNKINRNEIEGRKMIKVRKTIMNIMEGSSLLMDKKPKYIFRNGDNVIFHHEGNIISISSTERDYSFKITDTEYGVCDEFFKKNLKAFTEALKEDNKGIKIPETDGEVFDYIYESHKGHVARVERLYKKQQDDI